MKSFLTPAFHAFLLMGLALPVIWIPVAAAVWAFRNPTANSMSFWREFPRAIWFQKMEKYQGNIFRPGEQAFPVEGIE